MVYRGFQITVSHTPTTPLEQENFLHGRTLWTGELCSGGSLGQRSPTFWYKGPISWKTVCPRTGGEGYGLGMIQACYIYCALYF